MYNDQTSLGGSAVASRVVTAVSVWGQNIRDKASLSLKYLQHARMMGVLNSMTDQQLAAVNVARKDIRLEAARLVNLHL